MTSSTEEGVAQKVMTPYLDVRKIRSESSVSLTVLL